MPDVKEQQQEFKNHHYINLTYWSIQSHIEGMPPQVTTALGVRVLHHLLHAGTERQQDVVIATPLPDPEAPVFSVDWLSLSTSLMWQFGFGIGKRLNKVLWIETPPKCQLDHWFQSKQKSGDPIFSHALAYLRIRFNFDASGNPIAHRADTITRGTIASVLKS